MRRLIALLVAAVVLLVLLALTVGVGALGGSAPAYAASRPSPTNTPVPTQTPYPTYTAVPTWTPQPTATPVHRPALTLSASQEMPGEALIAAASDFPPGGTVTLSWDGGYLARGAADESGYIAFRVSVPGNASLGPHEVRAIGPAHTSASAPFVVAVLYHPALAVSQAQGPAATHLALAATGFAPLRTVSFYWDTVGSGTHVGDATTDDTGNASLDTTVGHGLSVGAHRLVAAQSTPALHAYAFFTALAVPPHCGGLEVPLPFVNPLCLDPFGWLTGALTDMVHNATAGVGTQVASALVEQQDYTQVDQLKAAFGTTQQLARDLFAVLFLAGALTWYARRLGMGPAGEAATQMVEGGLGLAVTSALPWMLGLYIGAVNGAARMILADPAKQGGDAIATLTAHLITTSLLDGLNPLFLGVIGGFVVLFFVLLVLIVITRIIGLIYAAAVYLAAPLCVVCMVSPLTRGVAKAWARLWFSLTLWGVSYALALAAVSAMLADFADKGLFNGGLQSLAEAIAGILVIYGAPKLGDALLGGGASRALGIGHVPLLSNAINYGVGAALGGIGGGAAAAGGEATAASGGTPSKPTVTEMPNASVSEIASIAPPINADWGLIE